MAHINPSLIARVHIPSIVVGSILLSEYDSCQRIWLMDYYNWVLVMAILQVGTCWIAEDPIFQPLLWELFCLFAYVFLLWYILGTCLFFIAIVPYCSGHLCNWGWMLWGLQMVSIAVTFYLLKQRHLE